MQFQSYLEIFDPRTLTAEQPYSPQGVLFTYYPSEEPESLHYHNFLELGYCERGSGIFIIDGEIIPFSEQCTTIIYDGQVHIAKSISPEKSLWHFLYIDLSKLFSGTEQFDLGLLKVRDHVNFEFPNLIPRADDPEIYEICRAVLNEAALAQTDHLAAMRGLLYALLVTHGRYFRRKECSVTDRTSLMDELGELLNYISLHYMEDITIDDLTAQTHMSKASLQRKMTAFTGLSPMQYIHRIRLNQAALMLQEKKKSVAQIATEVGYNSLSSFNRKFLDYFGMSPTKYKSRGTE